MEIKRLLQVGLILAGCIAAPAWALIVNDGVYEGTDYTGEDYWANKFSIPGVDNNGASSTFEAHSDQTAFTLMVDAMRSAYFEGLEDINSGGGTNSPGSLPKFDGGSYEVAEPGVLGLLGIGLIGIVLSRRRRAA